MTKEKCSVGRATVDICVSDLKKGDPFDEVSAVHFSLIKDVIDDPYSPVFIEVKQNNTIYYFDQKFDIIIGDNIVDSSTGSINEWNIHRKK